MNVLPWGCLRAGRWSRKNGVKGAVIPSLPLFFASPCSTLTSKVSLFLTSPRSKLSQFSEVKGRISRSKSKYFFLQQTLR